MGRRAAVAHHTGLVQGPHRARRSRAAAVAPQGTAAAHPPAAAPAAAARSPAGARLGPPAVRAGSRLPGGGGPAAAGRRRRRRPGGRAAADHAAAADRALPAAGEARLRHRRPVEGVGGAPPHPRCSLRRGSPDAAAVVRTRRAAAGVASVPLSGEARARRRSRAAAGAGRRHQSWAARRRRRTQWKVVVRSPAAVGRSPVVAARTHGLVDHTLVGQLAVAVSSHRVAQAAGGRHRAHTPGTHALSVDVLRHQAWNGPHVPGGDNGDYADEADSGPCWAGAHALRQGHDRGAWAAYRRSVAVTAHRIEAAVAVTP